MIKLKEVDQQVNMINYLISLDIVMKVVVSKVFFRFVRVSMIFIEDEILVMVVLNILKNVGHRFKGLVKDVYKNGRINGGNVLVERVKEISYTIYNGLVVSDLLDEDVLL